MFYKNLVYVERIQNQSEYHKQYISYRNYPEINFKQEKEESKEKYKQISQYMKKPKKDEAESIPFL